MGSDPTPSANAADAVDLLVTQVLERLTAGDAAALDELCAANPAQADTIRARVAALREMNLLPNDAAAMAFPERLGDFRLLRRLGGGGMGVVYEAVQESLGRTVALKLIRPEHLYFERSRERFQREIEAVARLAHPGIVGIYTVGEAQGTPYFAMEMIHGATLAQVLEQVAGLAPESLVGADLRAAVLALAPEDASTVPERLAELFEGTWAETCARVILRMTEALAHAHGRGVLHRDIKPSNIAVTPEGRVALLDFGLAGLEHELRLTASGSALGSVLYMAPEQLAGRTHEVDARTDVYALGVTLYELLALQTPFAGEDSEQTRAAILDGQPEPLRARYRGVPRDLEIVCLKAMERDRARRYASMEAFGEDLRNVLEHRAILARPPSAAYRVRRWMRRHPTATTASVLGSLLVTVVPSALYVQQRISSQRLERALAEATRARAAADEEEQRANDKALEAQEVASFLVDLYAASDPYNVGRRDVSAREILDHGVERVDAELGAQPELQALLFERIGESYINLDLYTQALVPLERALELRRALHGDDHARTAATMVQVASATRLAGRPGAADLLREASAVLEREEDVDVAVLINVRTLLARCLLDEGESEQPLALLDEARELLSSIQGERLDLHWLVLTMRATAHIRLGDPAAAEASAREALALEPTPDHRSIPWRCAALDTLATALRQQDELDQAANVYESFLPEAREFYGQDNVVLAQLESDYALLRRRLGRGEGVTEVLERAFRAMRAGLGAENAKTLSALSLLVEDWLRDGRFDPALELLRDVVAEIESRAGEDAPSCVAPLFWIGIHSLAKGDRATAIDTLRRALALADARETELIHTLSATLARALLGDATTRAEALDLARAASRSSVCGTRDVATYVLARAALDGGRDDEAEVELRRALAPGDSEPSWARLASRVLLAELLVDQGQLDQGCALLATSMDELARQLAPTHADLLALRARVEQSGAVERCRTHANGAPASDR